MHIVQVQKYRYANSNPYTSTELDAIKVGYHLHYLDSVDAKVRSDIISKVRGFR